MLEDEEKKEDQKSHIHRCDRTKNNMLYFNYQYWLPSFLARLLARLCKGPDRVGHLCASLLGDVDCNDIMSHIRQEDEVKISDDDHAYKDCWGYHCSYNGTITDAI